MGRGLCRIRRGATEAGRGDLLVAAAVEPNRSVLRSYLGKAFALEGGDPRSWEELELAIGLDPLDPTGWLYRALLNQQHNRINAAIRDLERSRELNDHRALFRDKAASYQRRWPWLRIDEGPLSVAAG